MKKQRASERAGRMCRRYFSQGRGKKFFPGRGIVVCVAFVSERRGWLCVNRLREKVFNTAKRTLDCARKNKLLALAGDWCVSCQSSADAKRRAVLFYVFAKQSAERSGEIRDRNPKGQDREPGLVRSMRARPEAKRREIPKTKKHNILGKYRGI